MKIVIKVGTQSILSEDGTPFEPVIFHLVEQIASLQKLGHQVTLVSSGAVGSGRKVTAQFFERQYGNSVGEKQLLASLGQYELMHLYAGLFKQHQLLASQLLLTKQDFHTRKHYLNIARLLREILEHKNIIPIINENDSVSIEELMFTDNDELSGLIAAQMNADKLIILSNIDGVFTGDPRVSGSELIPVIDPKKGWPEVSALKSKQGRGGMLSKLKTAKQMSNLGIVTHIANINIDSIILHLVNEEPLGTIILPNKKKSNIKRWLAYNADKQNGTIIVNECLKTILEKHDRVLSILPIGIQACSGNFKKGDFIEILGAEGERLGIGIAKYDAVQLQNYLGKKDQPEFIHYDYLHIF
jgi:glutamate 5-kinase